MPTQPAADFSPVISREQARNAIGDALRLFVGRGRRYSVKQLSNGTGVPDWQINTALIDASKPEHRPLPPEALLSIAGFLGARFTNEWLHLAGQGAFDLPDDEGDPAELAADNSLDNAKLTRAAVDPGFNAFEQREMRSVGERMIERGMRLVATGRSPAQDILEAQAADLRLALADYAGAA